MRSVLDPTFSPKMLKHMVGLISKCGLQMTEHLSERSGDEILTLNMKEFFSRFVSDVIASCGFGMECDSFKQPDNIFYKMAKTVHNVASRPNMILWRNLVSPRLFQLLKVQRLPTKVHDYFKSLVYNTMKFREVEDIVRPDMIHLLMQMRGEVSGDEEETKIASEETEKRHETVDERLVAQAVLFILAGLDSSTTLLCWASHLLATHPDVQLRLSNEIETVLGEKNGKLTYEELGNMKYLDMVLSETLRLFPPTVMTERVCVKSYTINETGPDPSFVLPKGQVVWIPIFPLHRDPKHFSEPERFDPERFSDENKPRIKPFTYLPFGAGRRSCIGSDLAFLLAKVALVHLISSSTLHVVSKTKTRIRFDKDQLTLSNENGFWLGVEPKNKTSSKSSSNLR
ncbi:cytochrome P450 9e2 isoform X2 [Anabrus simplex]